MVKRIMGYLSKEEEDSRPNYEDLRFVSTRKKVKKKKKKKKSRGK